MMGEHVSFEIFAAKDEMGKAAGIFMSVPCRCGLKDADTLKIDGLSMVATQFRSVMPLDFPAISTEDRERLVAWSATGKPLPVAEFMVRGLFDSYFLNVEVVQ
jgi:hypothetical protein